MKQLTAEQLEAIRKRAENATSGPWVWIEHEDTEEEENTEMPELKGADGVRVMDFGDCLQFYPEAGCPPDEADWEFIAAARTDIPALLAEIDRLNQMRIVKYYMVLQNKIERYEEALDRISDLYPNDLAPAGKYARRALKGESK